MNSITNYFSRLRSQRLCGVLLATIVMAIGLPVLNTFVVYPAFTNIITSSIEEDAQRLARHTLPASLKHVELTRQSLNDRFFADIYKLEHDFDLMKIKVFASNGDVLYSTEPTDVGHLNTKPYFTELIVKGHPYTKVVTKESKNMEGQPVPLDVVETYAPFMKDGKFLGAFELYYDITKRKERMDRLVTYSTATMTSLSLCLLFAVVAMINKEADRIKTQEKADHLKEEVERITRHDLKAPLTGVLTGIQYLEDFSKLDADQMDMLNEMRDAANQGIVMINHSLDLYKMEKKSYGYTPKTVDILGITRRVRNDLGHTAAVKGVDTLITLSGTVATDEDTLPFATEETLYYSLIANLLKNAIEASETGDRVTINLTSTKNLVITIHNSGSVPEEIRDSFFDKYTTAGKANGTGLGTYSAMLMARTMGGVIEMTTSIEEGTWLTVTLPMVEPEQPA